MGLIDDDSNITLSAICLSVLIKQSYLPVTTLNIISWRIGDFQLTNAHCISPFLFVWKPKLIFSAPARLYFNICLLGNEKQEKCQPRHIFSILSHIFVLLVDPPKVWRHCSKGLSITSIRIVLHYLLHCKKFKLQLCETPNTS